MMLCSFSDLVRLQFWVMAVIILGFLEKTFFVAEYSAINLGNDSESGFGGERQRRSICRQVYYMVLSFWHHLSV